MTRHNNTPPMNRIVSPNHPSVQGAQKRLIDEIDEWLDTEDNYANDAVPYELDDEQRVHLGDLLVIALLTLIVAFIVFEGAWLIGQVMV